MANGPQVVIPGQGWVDVFTRVIVQVGFPTVVAGVLLWFLLGKLTVTLHTIEHQEEDRTRIVAAMQDSLLAALAHQNTAFDASIKANIDSNKLIANRVVDALRDVRKK